MNYSNTRPGAVLIAVVLVIAVVCVGAYFFLGYQNTEADLLPGEAAYLEHVEAAEVLIDGGDTSLETCGVINNHLQSGMEAFKQMMPSLKGMQLRSRDQRLGNIREYWETECR